MVFGALKSKSSLVIFRDLKLLFPGLWNASLFLRGFIAALIITQFFAELTSIERFKFLKLVHLVLLSWSWLASLIGGWFGNVPFLPELSGHQVSAGALWLTFFLPYMLIIFPSRRERTVKSLSLWIAALLLTFFQAAMFAVNFETIDGPEVALVVFAGVFFVFRGLLRHSPKYARGFYSFLYFLVAMLFGFEALYFLNGAPFTEWVDEFSQRLSQ